MVASTVGLKPLDPTDASLLALLAGLPTQTSFDLLKDDFEDRRICRAILSEVQQPSLCHTTACEAARGLLKWVWTNKTVHAAPSRRHDPIRCDCTHCTYMRKAMVIGNES